MTAEELVSGLRGRGYRIVRSRAPGWVVIPRLAPDDPACEWLGKQGAFMRSYQTERWTNPEARAYEADLTRIKVSDEEPNAIWKAAANG